MKHGKGTLTTIYDRVNFYRDVHAEVVLEAFSRWVLERRKIGE